MTKSDFLAALQPRLRHSVKWRERQAAKYPNDLRNRRAIVDLERLAQSAPDDISDDVWLDLGAVLGRCPIDASRFLDAVAETARAVGFRTYPPHLDAFLESLMCRLTAGDAR